jgi:DNA gyrase subunit A
MRVVIELRRDVNPNRMLNSLLKHTQMRTTFGAILLALVDNVPRVMSLLDLLDHYLEHRRTVIERRTRYELYRAKSRAHILEGLQIALNFLDEIIRIIRQSETAEAARREMIRRFALTVLQADAILNTQLRQLARLEQEKLAEEYRGLLREITRLEHILSDPKQVEQIIKDDLRMLKEKYGDARRTRIIAREAEDISEEELIPEEETLVLITRDGYIKRVSMDAYRSQKRGGKGVIATTAREEDEVEHLFQVSTHHYILFFTDRGRVYRLKAYEIPETSRQARGTAVINYINIQPDEKVTATVSVRDFASEGYLTMITRGGEIKRTALSEFANLRSNGLERLRPGKRRLAGVGAAHFGQGRCAAGDARGTGDSLPRIGCACAGAHGGRREGDTARQGRRAGRRVPRVARRAAAGRLRERLRQMHPT